MHGELRPNQGLALYDWLIEQKYDCFLLPSAQLWFFLSHLADRRSLMEQVLNMAGLFGKEATFLCPTVRIHISGLPSESSVGSTPNRRSAPLA